MIRVACTALLKRIVAGRANKDGTALIGGGDDVTGDCLKATAELIGLGNSITLKVRGMDAYIMSVKAPNVAQGAEAVEYVPEGCTVADAKMLRKANHGLAASTPTGVQDERGAILALARHHAIDHERWSEDRVFAFAEAIKARAVSTSANVAQGAEAVKSAYRQGFMAGWNGEGEAISTPQSAPPAQTALADDARDATRYRWLRKQPNDTTAPRIDVVQWQEMDESSSEGHGLRLEELDAAIDAALSAAQSASNATP